MEIINKTGTYTIDSLGHISDDVKECEKCTLCCANEKNADFDGKITNPCCVEVKSIHDNCVKDIIGDKYNEVINSIKGEVEERQCHYNSWRSGIEIKNRCNVSVYYCAGFAKSCILHCILYVTDGKKGAFIDPTELALNRLISDKFDLYYFSPFEKVNKVFAKRGKFYNPLIGYWF